MRVCEANTTNRLAETEGYRSKLDGGHGGAAALRLGGGTLPGGLRLGEINTSLSKSQVTYWSNSQASASPALSGAMHGGGP